MNYNYTDEKSNVLIIIMGIFGAFALIALLMWGGPKYRIYRQDLKGQANLRQQEWEKKIAVEAARAKKDAASLEAEAEIERAKGVAKANEIIADSLKGNESYLRYLWIDKVAESKNLIYVPTEANLPILEAGRR